MNKWLIVAISIILAFVAFGGWWHLQAKNRTPQAAGALATPVFHETKILSPDVTRKCTWQVETPDSHGKKGQSVRMYSSGEKEITITAPTVNDEVVSGSNAYHLILEGNLYTWTSATSVGYKSPADLSPGAKTLREKLLVENHAVCEPWAPEPNEPDRFRIPAEVNFQ